MYRLLLGKVSELSAQPLPCALIKHAPEGARRARWLAGRVLLSYALSPLPKIVYSAQGKPAFAAGLSLWFNLSHSGDHIALLLSDEGEVGCDIEVIRPRKNWPALVEKIFSVGEQAEITCVGEEQKLTSFWQIWTRKEAIIKQRGGNVWEMASVDSTHFTEGFIAHYQRGALSLSLCTPTPSSHIEIIFAAVNNRGELMFTRSPD